MAHLLWPATLNNDVVVKTLTDPATRDRFLAYCQDVDLTPENAWFALAVPQYRASPYWHEAAVLIEAFIRQSSPYQVNISTALRVPIEQNLDTNQSVLPPQDLFDAALDEVIRVLRNNSYPRFKAYVPVELKGKIGNGPVRPYIYAQRARHLAKVGLAQTDAQLARTAKAAPTSISGVRAGQEQERRALLRKVLRAGSYDLSLMGLA
jgi:hypothetical protein